MTTEQRKRTLTVTEVLEKLNFVKWDRFSGFFVFGWIEREDSYKDFVVVEFVNGNPVMFVTSSKKYSKKISKLLYLEVSHEKCKRVEDYFLIKNSIKL